MHRKGMDGGSGPRRGAERDAAQPMAGQPRSDDDDDDALEQPENVPSFLTAQELQARDPAKGQEGDGEGGDRHGSAEFAGAKGEPMITDDEPPRGERGLPMDRSNQMAKKGRGRKSK